MSEPPDALGVAVSDLLLVAVAERGALKPGHGLVAGFVGIVDGEHDRVRADLQDGAGERRRRFSPATGLSCVVWPQSPNAFPPLAMIV